MSASNGKTMSFLHTCQPPSKLDATYIALFPHRVDALPRADHPHGIAVNRVFTGVPAAISADSDATRPVDGDRAFRPGRLH